MKSMDFQSAMETFAEAWVAANAKTAVLDAASHQVRTLIIFTLRKKRRGKCKMSDNGDDPLETRQLERLMSIRGD